MTDGQSSKLKDNQEVNENERKHVKESIFNRKKRRTGNMPEKLEKNRLTELAARVDNLRRYL
jgi:hypothetical protein